MEQQEFLHRLSSYQAMSEMLKTYSYEEILNAAADLIRIAPNDLEHYPMGGYSKGRTSGAYRFTLQDLQRNILSYDWLFSRLADDTSRIVFSNLVGYRIVPARSFLEAAYDGEHPQYFDKSIVSCDGNEVFVDCGGFTGDTTEEFIRQFPDYKHIYVYEPSPDNMRTCRDNLSKYKNISIQPYGVGERKDFLSLEGSGSSSSFMLGQHGEQGIEIVALDENIKEKVTFIKMDVEGAEIPALLGAKKHIRDDFPKLAVCTYHIVSDMWEIPRLIDTIRPGYQFHIRHYHIPENWETVIYAIPPKQAKQTVPAYKKRKRVVALSAEEGWMNIQLIKECGSIPYLLYKNHGCLAGMAGGRREKEYPNAEYIKGVDMEFLPDGSMRAKTDFLRKEATDIDALLFRGPYFSYHPLAEIYKQQNPAGKIYLALDANSNWMDRIQWEASTFSRFMEQCDVIGTSGRTMQKYLNEKWPWNIEYIPNGFYDFTGQMPPYSFGQKENIILTVGRLGTPQKATHILMEAFARIAGDIPDWSLHLAGSRTPEFEDYLNGFWERFPALKERILFLGNLADKHALYQEYAKAKIFALPSAWEGGTPNVIAEALYAGDAIAITKIDEYADATDRGRCGMAADIGDTEGFAGILLRLCQREDLEQLCSRAHAYAKETYDMEKITARLYYMLFGKEQ